MNFAINMKSVVCKLWFAVLMGALIQVGLLDAVQAQTKKTQKAPELALDSYIGQVREGNSAFKGTELAAEGASLRADEYKLITRPTLVGDAGYRDDRTETGNALLGDRQVGYNYSLGIRQITDFGLAGTLSYKFGWASVPDANAGFVNPKSFYTGSPVLELNQSLWRNGFGRQTRAAKQLQSAQSLATKYGNSFAQKEMVSGAEATYWRLALAREAVELSKENLQRAERLRGWSSGRQRSGLGDRSDFLQAGTAYLARELELRAAVDEEKAASRAFNTMRGLDSDVVTENLMVFTGDVIDARMRLPERAGLRDDVRAAEQEARIAEAQANLGAEKNRPLVDVYASLAHNGRDSAKYPATKESLGNDHPNYAVGVKLEIPLDLGTMSDTVKGYKGEARAAQLTYDYRKFESERLWKDLSIGLQDSLARYKLAAEIEKASREKMDYERVRHGRGRTTTFQVIQFETDYATAQLNRIRTQFEILNQYAKLRTFAGGN